MVNDKPIYLKGFGRHEDSPFAGRAFDLNVEKKDFALMKWIGANSFRTSHYPYDEQVYKIADEEGFLLTDEVPAVGFKMAAAAFLGGLNQSFFKGPWLKKLHERHIDQIRDLIKRDKNHPSVLAWSLFNEPDTIDENAVPYFKQIFDESKDLDPQSRPRTFTLSEDDTIETSKVLDFPDFYMLNRYPGWYHFGGYQISDGEVGLRDEMDKWQKAGVTKPVVFTEFGADTEAGLHKLPSVMWTEEYQVEVLKMFSRVFDDYDFIKGEQVWNLADFQTVEGNMRVNGNKKGIFTRDRQPKAAAFFYHDRWNKLPLDYKAK
ncbi:beta-glucuronidase [Lacticaseibacillus paracasei subsp. paracasei Lpp126]|uniref:Beta-glucuronidase n=1 Tax=Lacticaseibacillus paracasei subsp. paracasei Lpp126 TaxID=1256206 RepID=S2S3R5_LACPA|nr:beta-glucuronidase [Lacticaseibacillus paracasei subsp. paracasei Lpp126]